MIVYLRNIATKEQYYETDNHSIIHFCNNHACRGNHRRTHYGNSVCDAGDLPHSLVLYAVATDDTHNYTHFYHAFEGKRNSMRPCYVCVRAKALSTEALIDAMNGGDFYASNGIEINDVTFDKASGTLSVDVNPGKLKNIVIRFYGTKKGFDQSVGEGTEYVLKDVAEKVKKQVPAWAGKTRRIRTFSEEIGVVLKEVHGPKASYTLQKDDLYVRAKIFERTRVGNEDMIPPYTSVAWTQPYGFRK